MLQPLFVKLDNMVCMLHSQGKAPWKSYAEVPAESISNMDKVTMNAHNQQKKVIAAQTLLGPLFQECSSGDNKMPFHISLVVTSNATGTLIFNLFAKIYFKG